MIKFPKHLEATQQFILLRRESIQSTELQILALNNTGFSV